MAVAPSDDRPEGKGTGAQGHPKASWQQGGLSLNHTALPLIEYATVYLMFDAMLLFWQQPLWKSIF